MARRGLCSVRAPRDFEQTAPPSLDLTLFDSLGHPA